MFKTKAAHRSLKWLTIVFASASLGAGGLQAAAVVGQWNQNPASTVWASSGNFSSFYSSAFVTGGHSINPAGTTGEVTLSNLQNFSHFVMNTSASAAPTNFADLSTWVTGGGILVLFANGNNDATSNALGNSILSAVGSTLSLAGGTVGTGFSVVPLGSLVGPDNAVVGTVNLTGNPLAMFRSNVVTGGTALAQWQVPNAESNLGAALRVNNVGLGKVYVFGEHFEANTYISTSNNNLQLFLNLLAQGQTQGGGGGSPGGDVPEPATVLLTGVALAGIALVKRRV